MLQYAGWKQSLKSLTPAVFNFRPKKLTLNKYKQFWFKFQDTSISYFKSKEESIGEAIQQINLKGVPYFPYLAFLRSGSFTQKLMGSLIILKFQSLLNVKNSNSIASESEGGQLGCLWLKDSLVSTLLSGCEVAPDVNVSAQKFLIRLLVPAPEGMSEVYLRCEDVRPHAPGPSASSVSLSLSLVLPWRGAGAAVRSVDGCVPAGFQRQDAGRRQLPERDPDHSLLPGDAKERLQFPWQHAYQWREHQHSQPSVATVP